MYFLKNTNIEIKTENSPLKKNLTGSPYKEEPSPLPNLNGQAKEPEDDILKGGSGRTGDPLSTAVMKMFKFKEIGQIKQILV